MEKKRRKEIKEKEKNEMKKNSKQQKM